MANASSDLTAGQERDYSYMHKRRIFLALSFTAWIASSSFANPQTLLNSSADQTALDSYVTQMWTTQQQLVDSLSASGLIEADAQHDHYHDYGTGMGGEYNGEMSVLATAEDDGIQQQIDEISRQAQARQDNLGQLSQALTVTRSYRSSGSVAPESNLNVNANALLAIEPIANARVSSKFGYRTMSGRGEYHPGIDLAAPTGTPIYATGDGIVIRAGWVNGYGNLVEIDHGNGLITRYGHASRLYVSVGDVVKANQNIAAVGCTGRCTGPHVHYEVLKDGKRENPATYLALAPKRES
ncbi:M23 family metallopeptidase [Alkanindiges illinoisensis]